VRLSSENSARIASVPTRLPRIVESIRVEGIVSELRKRWLPRDGKW
jgi:hypothetical protein